MSEEERLTLNLYLEGLYQAMQIGDIVYEPKHSSELYNLINKLLEENQKYKEVINKAINLLGNYIHYSVPDEKQNSYNEDLVNKAYDILKEVEHEKSNN